MMCKFELPFCKLIMLVFVTMAILAFQDDDELKKQNRSFLLQLFSPIFLKVSLSVYYEIPIFCIKVILCWRFLLLDTETVVTLQAFSITFFGEWGDKSQVSICPTE